MEPAGEPGYSGASNARRAQDTDRREGEQAEGDGREGEQDEADGREGEQDEADGRTTLETLSLSQQSNSSDDSDAEPPPVIGRKVSFADAFGLNLVSVKEFDNWNASVPPADAATGREGAGTDLEEHVLSCLFTVPCTAEDLMHKLEEQGLELESIELVPGTTSLRGVIRVLNLCFDKMVYVRTTLDHWSTHFDLLAEFIPGSSDGQTDRFLFQLTLVPPLENENTRVEFCLRYETAAGTFWANNNGMNYVLFCNKKQKEARESYLERSSRKNKKSCLKISSKEQSPEEHMALASAETKDEDGRGADVKNQDTRSELLHEDARQKASVDDSCGSWLTVRRSRRRVSRLARGRDHTPQREAEVPPMDPLTKERELRDVEGPGASAPLGSAVFSLPVSWNRNQMNGPPADKPFTAGLSDSREDLRNVEVWTSNTVHGVGKVSSGVSGQLMPEIGLESGPWQYSDVRFQGDNERDQNSHSDVRFHGENERGQNSNSDNCTEETLSPHYRHHLESETCTGNHPEVRGREESASEEEAEDGAVGDRASKSQPDRVALGGFSTEASMIQTPFSSPFVASVVGLRSPEEIREPAPDHLPGAEMKAPSEPLTHRGRIQEVLSTSATVTQSPGGAGADPRAGRPAGYEGSQIKGYFTALAVENATSPGERDADRQTVRTVTHETAAANGQDAISPTGCDVTAEVRSAATLTLPETFREKTKNIDKPQGGKEGLDTGTKGAALEEQDIEKDKCTFKEIPHDGDQEEVSTRKEDLDGEGEAAWERDTVNGESLFREKEIDLHQGEEGFREDKAGGRRDGQVVFGEGTEDCGEGRGRAHIESLIEGAGEDNVCMERWRLEELSTDQTTGENDRDQPGSVNRRAPLSLEKTRPTSWLLSNQPRGADSGFESEGAPPQEAKLALEVTRDPTTVTNFPLERAGSTPSDYVWWWRGLFSSDRISRAFLYTLLFALFSTMAFQYGLLACFTLYLVSVCWLHRHEDKQHLQGGDTHSIGRDMLK